MKLFLKLASALIVPLAILPLPLDLALHAAISLTWGGFCGWVIWPEIEDKFREAA